MVLGVPPRPVPQAASWDAAAAPRNRGGQAAGSPRAPPSALLGRPHPSARRFAATARGGRQRGACAVARSRPGPWALPGGREVGTWGGAEQHTSSPPQATLAPRGPSARHARRRRGSEAQVSARAGAIPSGAPASARPRSGRRARKVELRASQAAGPGHQGVAGCRGGLCRVPGRGTLDAEPDPRCVRVWPRGELFPGLGARWQRAKTAGGLAARVA